MTIDRLPFPKKFGYNNAKTYITTEPTFLSDITIKGVIEIPAGIELKLFTYTNWGLVMIPREIANGRSTMWRY
jgi:hypothetical protein